MKIALLIGINYTSVPSCTLQGCINDVIDMSQILVSQYGYDSSNITMLRDDIPSKMPTRTAIITALNNIVTASKSNLCTEVWIHYSGHGSQVRNLTRDETTGLDSVIVPVDYQTAGFIIDDFIFQFISQITCPTVIVMDSCHSGTVCDLEWSFEYQYGSLFRRTHNNQKVVKNPNIIMFSGCKDTGTSADFYDTDDQKSEGAFTDAFLRALRNNKYKAPAWVIHKDICTRLKEGGFTQIPIFSTTTPNMLWNFTPYVPQIPIIGNGQSILPSKIVVKQKMIMNFL